MCIRDSTRAHSWVYRLTGGRFGGRLLGMQQVLLTTRGRQSGLPRTTPLSAFPLGAGSSAGSAAATAGALSTGALVLVASDGGRPQHPQWYRNPVSYTHLRAHETRHDLVCRLLL